MRNILFAFQIKSRIVFTLYLFVCYCFWYEYVDKSHVSYYASFAFCATCAHTLQSIALHSQSMNPCLYIDLVFVDCSLCRRSSFFLYFFLYSSSSLFRYIYHSTRLNRSNYGKRSNLIDFIDEFHRKVHPNRSSAFLQISIHVGRILRLTAMKCSEKKKNNSEIKTLFAIFCR